MKRKINPGGINTGNVLEKTSCPVHVSELNHMYHEEKMSISKIALSLGVSTYCVHKWMQKTGIARRSLSLSRVIYLAKNPGVIPEPYAKTREGWAAYHERNKHDPQYIKQQKERMSKALKMKNALAEIRRVKCICKQCGKSFTVPSSTAQLGKGKYCSISCCAKASSARRKLNAQQPT